MHKERINPDWQYVLELPAKPRGFHLITDAITHALKEMNPKQPRLVHLFLRHTSASLLISENASAAVAEDLENCFNHLVPEGETLYRHADEGTDDMPAHIKNAMLGVSLTVPWYQGGLGLGRWQGIYLCEHRNQARPRQVVISVY